MDLLSITYLPATVNKLFKKLMFFKHRIILLLCRFLVFAAASALFFTMPVYADTPVIVLPTASNVETSVLDSTNMTITGEKVRFVNITDEELQNMLNKHLEGFYSNVLDAPIENGVPYPAVDFDVKVDSFSSRFTLNVIARTLYPEYAKLQGFQIIITNKEVNIFTSQVPLSETLMLSEASGDFYITEAPAVPFRLISEFLGYEVYWNGKSAMADKDIGTVVITPFVNEYNGRQLEFAPQNVDGVIYVPLSLYSSVLGFYTALGGDTLIIAKDVFGESYTVKVDITIDEEGHVQESGDLQDTIEKSSTGSVLGTISELTYRSMYVVTPNGEKYELALNGLNVKEIEGINVNAYIYAEYSDGSKQDTATVAVLEKVMPSSINGYTDGATNTFVGTVESSGAMNVLRIRTPAGQSITFLLNDYWMAYVQNLKAKTLVAVEFTGGYNNNSIDDISVVNITNLEQEDAR